MAEIRLPAVAGQFYPLKPRELREQIKSFAGPRIPAVIKKEAIACLLPHAGYIYSGSVAYSVVSQLKIKKNLIILGPNHTGMGANFSIMAEGSWETPLGKVEINPSLADKLLSKSALLKSDTQAHKFEHSIEVELPFFQYFSQDFTFVPIAVGSGDFKNYQQLGLDIAAGLKEAGLEKETLIAASSDMTHYEDAKSARHKDHQAIEAIQELDECKLYSRVKELNISMCGYAPAIAMLCAAKSLGAKKAELIKYQTSAEATGDTSSVVGYAGMIVT
ncbi:MAG: AmmeMemoRadiSam system protein B [Candidatus Omnitrophota bacterium]|nr:AmmeMemoRadiSam system protein B [Candidatus Omnitrophota bacterium]